MFKRNLIFATLGCVIFCNIAEAAFRAVTQANSPGIAVTQLTTDKPAGTVDGDVIVLCVALEDVSLTVTWPSGFTQITENPSTNDATFRCAWKVASSEGSTYQVTFASVDFCQLIAASWSGRNASQWSATPVVTVKNTQTASPNTVTATGITAASGDDIAIFVGISSNNNANPFVMTPPTDYTVRMDSTTASYTHAQLATRDNVSSGATGNLVFTETSAFDASRVGVLVLAIAQAVTPSVDGSMFLIF